MKDPFFTAILHLKLRLLVLLRVGDSRCLYLIQDHDPTAIKVAKSIYPWDKGEVNCDCTVTFIPGKKVGKHVTFIPNFFQG